MPWTARFKPGDLRGLPAKSEYYGILDGYWLMMMMMMMMSARPYKVSEMFVFVEK